MGRTRGGKKIAKTSEVVVGAIPECAVFSPDDKWLYVGNYAHKNISVLRVDGDKITDTGKPVPLPGSPASMRGGVQ